VPLKCAVVSLYSVVKQRLKYNTGKVFNCFIQFLLTTVLSIKERVFLVEYVFREGSRYTDLVQEKFAEKFTETPSDLQKGFVNRIKWVQACIDARGHKFQHLL
jgi:mannose/fructose/N-acetylgalactosamine-specific phosphotransferase system component IID